jgi:cellulose synthase/poly-beta-1,6-N-acetylglucosamine synthase-like glycosyltransferase
LISAIIPVRNEEASVARVIESLAGQPEIGEIIAVDDQSSDRTPAILRDLAARLPQMRILPTAELPPGWTGKNYAVATGAAVARGDWLLFTDADTLHAPGSAARALANATRWGADLVSYSPEQEMHTLWEKALVPFVYWRLSQRYPFRLVNDAGSPDAAANGQYILMRREVYESTGGHAAVAGEVLEDIALARLVKADGWRIFFGPGTGIVQTRMYGSFASMWEGWTKNLCPLFGRSLSDILVEIDAATPWLGLMFAGLLAVEWAMRGRMQVDWLMAIVAAVFIVRPCVCYEAWLRRNRYPARLIRYYLIGAGLYTAMLVASWWKTTHGFVSWKGRAYARPV